MRLVYLGGYYSLLFGLKNICGYYYGGGFYSPAVVIMDNTVDKMSANDANCKCAAMFPTQLWSMKKMTWAKKTPEFPPNILMLSGCAIPINRNKVLFIGGHYLQHQNNHKTWNIDVST